MALQSSHLILWTYQITLQPLQPHLQKFIHHTKGLICNSRGTCCCCSRFLKNLMGAALPEFLQAKDTPGLNCCWLAPSSKNEQKTEQTHITMLYIADDVDASKFGNQSTLVKPPPFAHPLLLRLETLYILKELLTTSHKV